MPLTLYRYILSDLLKLLLISTAVLVTAISIAVSIKPLSEGLVGPVVMAKFVLFTMPTVLGFALPFAAAFSATMVFIRMASDNELLACSASGISYGSLLAPVLALGLVLMISLGLLSNLVVPGFLRLARQTLQADVVATIVNQLNRDRPFVTGDHRFMLHADEAEEAVPPPIPGAELQPERFVQMRRVAVAQLDRSGVVRADVTAERANMLMFRDPVTRRAWVTLRLRNVMWYQPEKGELAHFSFSDIPPQEIPSPFSDRPKYMSFSELRALDRHPERFGEVRDRMDDLAAALAVQRLRLLLEEGVARPDRSGIQLTGPLEGEVYYLSAAQVRVGRDRNLTLVGEPGRPVVLEKRRYGAIERRMEAAGGLLVVSQDEGGIEPNVSLALRQVRVYDRALSGPSTEHPVLDLPRMTWPEPVFQIDHPEGEGGRASAGQLRALAEQPQFAASPEVRNAYVQLRTSMFKLTRRIVSQLHERVATAASSMLLLLIGVLLSIRLKDHQPLVVFFLTFLLAIATLVVISGGENIAASDKHSMVMGVGVIWVGNLALVLIALRLFLAIRRN